MQGSQAAARGGLALLFGAALFQAAWAGAEVGSLEVPGGTAGLLEAAGLDPALPRWQALYEVTRRLHPTYGDAAGSVRAAERVRAFLEQADGAASRVARMATGPRAAVGGADAPALAPGYRSTVPLPLDPSVWSAVVFDRAVPETSLLAAILGDRNASLLYRGLVQLDPATLGVLERDRETLREIHRRRAEVFSVFAGSFHVRDGRVDTPGGREAAGLWESLVGESPAQPGPFLRRLLAREEGRAAYFYDTVARLDPAHQRFALGLGQGDGSRREERVHSLAGVFLGEAAWWRAAGGAFNRPVDGPAAVLRLVRVDASGRMAPPAGRAFWEAAFADAPAKDAEALGAGEGVDAAWLVEQVGHGSPDVRRERLLKVAFAQRVFGSLAGAELPQALVAVRGVGREPALVLGLERMGVTAPRLLAEAVRVAEHVAGLGRRPETAVALAQLEGALSLIERARLAGTLDASVAASLLESLLAVPLEDGRYGTRIADWLREKALPVFRVSTYGSLPPGTDEEVVTRALAGAVLKRTEASRVFEWEGLYYRADVREADRRRIEKVRRRQGGKSLDAVLALTGTFDKKGDGERERPPSVSLTRHRDTEVADVLLSFAYAPHLGTPDGTALAGSNVALRHQFGPAPWAVPEEAPQIGVSWHVRGSLLGLDIALAGQSLRRLSADMPLHPPGLDAPTRVSLARLVSLMDPAALDDRDQAAIAEAIERGRLRAARLATALDDAAEAAREAGLDAWRARSLEWAIANEPAALKHFFSLLELLRLGRPGDGRFDAWGAATLGEDGGWRLRLPGARPFDDIAGERLEDLLATRFADLGLLAAVELQARGLPAVLAPGLLAYFIQDMVEEARPRAHDDWLALARFVQEIPAERVDDIVSAQAGGGALLPAREPAAAR